MATWTGKTALVTGAASGIGLALAQELAARGAQVTLTDIDGDRARKAAANMPGGPHKAAACDVTDPAAVTSLLTQNTTDGRAPDLVVANAGVMVAGPLAEQPLSDIQWMVNVNVFGTLHVARAAIQAWKSAGQTGQLLITGSENSLSLPQAVATLNLGAYNATKHAVLSFADVLRTEGAANGIAVSLLCPGPVPSRLATGVRRRPEAFGGPGDMPQTPLDPAVLETLAQQNMEPETIAKITINGVEADQFYILTHPHMRADVERRYGEILAAMPTQ